MTQKSDQYISFFFSSRGRHTRSTRDWSSDVCSSDLIGLALGAATLVGGVWYLRNLFEHGSPFWPIVSTPWGDPVAASVKAVETSFLDRPGATIDVLGHSYLARFGGSLLLLAGGALAPLAAPRRRVMLAAAAVVVGLLVW